MVNGGINLSLSNKSVNQKKSNTIFFKILVGKGLSVGSQRFGAMTSIEKWKDSRKIGRQNAFFPYFQ